MQEEIWKDVPNYEGLYQVSNIGRVKHLQCNVYKKDGSFHYTKKEKVKDVKMKQTYKFVNLNGKKFYIHQLVAMAFLNHVPNRYNFVVDHIDGNPNNNNLKNLQVVTQSVNMIKANKRKCYTTSKYKGVSYDKSRCKWIALATRMGKTKYLGRFKTEEEAYNKYLEFNNK